MDYFNEAERQKQRGFAAWRDRVLNPIVSLLQSLHIHPNTVTIFAVLLLIAGVSLPTQQENWFFISILIFSYCVLDGLDGPLARHMGKAHQGGAMLDMAADQVGIPLVAAAAAFHWGVDPWSAVLFTASYLSFIMLAVYANQHGIKLWPFMRVKYFFYFLYCLSSLIQYEILVFATPVFAIYYSLYTLHGLHKIYAHFSELHALENQNNKQENSQ